MNISKVITADHDFFVLMAIRNASASNGRSAWDSHCWIDACVNERATIARLIKERKTDDNMIYVAESGMDCDCVKYQYGAYKIPATMESFYKERDRFLYSAEGPCSLSICKPDQLPESWSRDLAFEAFENGHAHVVYS